MQNSPLVTVITATYNGERTLPYTVQSVVNQDFKDFEYWVVGDACTDDCESVVTSFRDQRIKWVNLPTNSGNQSVPNNVGLRKARGKYIAFIGHDDLWFPWHLSTLVEAIEDEDADFVHSLSASIGRKNRIWLNGPPRKGSNYKYQYFPTSSWVHKREVVERIGFWRDWDTLSWAIDFDVTRRAYLAGLKIKFIPQLSVLKFPSPTWQSYKSDSSIPQAEYSQKMLQDADRLAYQVLLSSSVTFCRYQKRDHRKPLSLAYADLKESIRWFRKSLIQRILEIYGVERWPVSNYLINRNKQKRLKRNKIRGL